MGKRGPRPGTEGYRPPRPVRDRILERVRIDPETDCWIWPSLRDKKGYGGITIGSRLDGTMRQARIHRVSYEEFVGPIPDGLTIDHLCENKACCNPAHLEPVTNAENKRRAGERMTACRRGHPRTPANAYVNRTSGKVQCRICKREAAARRKVAA